MLGELRRPARRGRGASRTRRRRAGSRGRTRRGGEPSAGHELAVDPDVAPGEPPATGRSRHLAGADARVSGPRAFATVSSHSAAGSLRQVIPPPTWRLSRSPSATNVRIRMLVRHRAVGPEPAGDARVRPAPDGLEPLQQLHRPDLRGAGDRAAGERGREEVERVAAGREPAGHGADEVLHGGGPLEAAQARDADACPARRPARGRCAGRRRSSRSRRGPSPTRAARRRAGGRPRDRGRGGACP